MPYVGLIPFIVSMVISLGAQLWVSLSFWRYNRVLSSAGQTGFSTARRLLDGNGLSGIVVEQVKGRLSELTYGSSSVAAVGVAAHETGHAIQHRDGYLPNKIRSALLVPANIGSMAGPYVAGLGFVLDGFLSDLLIQAGMALFAAAVLFYLITLPVEINASHRALNLLEETDILASHEMKGVRRVLRAAALTYIASAMISVFYFFRLSYMAGSRRHG
ncbi:MAG: zinc metallopeptidase [Clostridiaceae bacterium]|nr:zinc metallopeptidase [Clostridiaceae bacterium]